MGILADQHVHSHHSGDSRERMEAVAGQAIERGLTSLCFTEHEDYDYPAVDDPRITAQTFLLDLEAYRQEYLRIRDQFSDRITLHFGVELGLQPLASVISENCRFVQNAPFDLVIASTHVAGRRDPYYPSFYEGRTEEEALREIFAETLENIRLFEDFDVVGHLDYPIRYLPSGRQRIDLSASRELLDEIFRLLIRREQGLDLNTEQIRRGYDEMNPSRELLARYHELGGRIITFGSDAHQAERVAGFFDRAERIAREAGFTEYCVYENRKPAFIAFS
ncbi:MAG: histidinol-phosphatase HisJ family protein [Lachnospiraceae bacterium]|nr:histidinol-phosphatase HisJ family protein [Lachnospiraceae bacterium]